MRILNLYAPLRARVALLFLLAAAAGCRIRAATLQELLVEMEHTAPALAEARVTLAAAHAALVQTRVFPNPTLFAEQEDLGEDHPAETTYGVRQNVSFLWSQVPAIAVRRQALENTHLQYEELRQELQMEIVKGVIAYRGLRALGAVMDSVLLLAAKVDTAIERRAAAGDISDYDRQRFRIEILALQNRRRHVLKGEEETLLRLVQQSGLSADRWEAVVLPSAVGVPALSFDSAWAFAMAHRPLLRAAALECAAAAGKVHAARLQQLPELSVGLGRKRGADGNAGFVVTGELELPLWHQRRSETRLAVQEHARAQTHLAATREQVRREVQAAWKQWQYATTLAATGDFPNNGTIALNMQRGIALYLHGEIGFLELVDALRTGFEAQEAALEVGNARMVAALELRRAMGMSILE